MGGLSDFFYVLKVSICWESLDTLKANRNFDLSDYAWDEIALFLLFQAFTRKRVFT